MQSSRRDSQEALHFLPPGISVKKRAWSPTFSQFLIVQIPFLLLFSLLTWLNLESISYKGALIIDFTQQRAHSRLHLFNLVAQSPYAGAPSPTLERAWTDLLAQTNIRVSREELERRNQTSVPMPDGQGYLAWLEATHQLHCVKMVRQWIYRDHYHPSLTATEVEHWMLHADHCLELLRQAVMCHADTTLMTFRWDKAHRQPMLKLHGPQHVCWDWEELMSRMEPRVILPEEMKRLRNPTGVN